ncbi:MAG: MATE family efflux transporter [Sulfurovum sp.]|nr:MAG: MATE family efflux transporter [Sulfurovum sp.]
MDVIKDNPLKIFIQYALPAVLGMLAISSASVVDGFFVGNYVGASGLAAINMSIPLFSLLFGLALMLSIGSSVISGKLMAEGDSKSASMMFTKTFIAMLVISISLTSVLYLNMQTILEWFGATEELVTLSIEYLQYILIFIPFLMIGIVLDYFVKIDSRPILAFGALLFSALVNVFLDWFMIVYLEQGIVGAALATGLSQVALLIVLLPHFFSKKTSIHFVKLTGSWMSIIKAGSNGASEFVNETSIGITTVIFNYIMIKNFSVDGVAAYTVVNYILWISIMVSFGISDSLTPIISKNFGAKKPERVVLFLKYAFISVLFVGVSLSAIVLIMPEMIIDMFLEQKDQSAMAIILVFLSFVWPAFLFNGSNMVISAYFTAMHKPLPSATIAFSRSLVFPVFFIVVLPIFLGDMGIYLAIPFSEFFAFLMAVLFLRSSPAQKIIEGSYNEHKV